MIPTLDYCWVLVSSHKDGEAEAHPYKEHVQIYTKTHVLQI